MTAGMDILGWLLLAAGGLFVFVGGIGALRLPDVYMRMHGASLTDTMGTVLVLAGLAVQAGWTLALAKLAAILFFLLMTSPTAGYALANAALLSGLQPRTEKE